MKLRYQTEDDFYARLRREYMSADGENGDKILRFVLRGAQGMLKTFLIIPVMVEG